MTDTFVETKTVNLEDGTQIEVSSLPSNIQTSIAVFDEWRRAELTARKEIMKTQYALRILGSEIARDVKAHMNPEPTEDVSLKPSELDEVSTDSIE